MKQAHNNSTPQQRGTHSHNQKSTRGNAMAVPGYWFSKNPDKAWAEKFYLLFIPVFFAYNAMIQNLHWLDVGDFWHIAQTLGMWIPYCLILPWYLRRNSGVRWQDSYWLKFNIWL